MAVEYSDLSGQPFDVIHRAFAEAFADYYVDTSGMTETVLYNRAVKNGVDFAASVGAFDRGRLVGFTIVGLDRWNGVSAAYDIGTGVLPSHRGRGIAGSMFDFALPRLRERGVKTFVLEVIRENSPAIRAYTAAGFGVNREFDCYELALEQPAAPPAPPPVEIQAVNRASLDEFESHLDWQPSWENSFGSLRRVPDELELYVATVDGRRAGLLVYYPLINWITTVVVKKPFRRRGVATGLLAHLAERLRGRVPLVKLVNLDRSDDGFRAMLEPTGFTRTVSQYEMEKSLD